SVALSTDTLAFLQYTSGSTSTPKGVMVSHGNILSNLAEIATALGHDTGSVLVSWAPIFHDMGLIYGVLSPVFAGCLGVLMSPMMFAAHPLEWLRVMSRYRGTHTAVPNFAYELCLRKVTNADLASFDFRNWRVSLTSAEPVRADTVLGFTEKFAACGFAP